MSTRPFAAVYAAFAIPVLLALLYGLLTQALRPDAAAAIAAALALPAIGVPAAVMARRGAQREPVAPAATSRRQMMEELGRELRRELNRSRRYEHPFVLVRAELEAAETDGEMRGAIQTINARLRDTDHVWGYEREIYALLPESGAAAAEPFVARLRAAADDRLSSDSVTVAAFPDDGLTIPALMEALHRSTERPRQMRPTLRIAKRADEDRRAG